MSDVYAIKTTTLTALGDAIRSKVGETRKEMFSTTTYSGQLVKPADQEIISTDFLGINDNRYDIESVKLKLIQSEIISEGNLICYYQYNTGGSTFQNFEFDENGEAILELPGKLYFTVTLQEPGGWGNAGICNYIIEATFYTGDALTGEVEEIEYEIPNTMTPLQMAEQINNILPGPTAEELVVTGNCQYKFANGSWDWFIKKYDNLITTKDINNGISMFFNASTITEIPFDLNFLHPGTGAYSYTGVSDLFSGCNSLTKVPKINGLRPQSLDDTFCDCRNLKEVSYESVKDIDWSYIDGLTGSSGGNRSNTFNGCYKLRSFPMEFLNHYNQYGRYSVSLYYNGFNACYSLDEIIGLPVVNRLSTNFTTNAFYNTFDMNYRLKNMTFALQEDGSPYECPKWKNQIIDLTSVGTMSSTVISNGYVDFTYDTEIKDDATYQALKDHPDAWASDVAYSRYNHDSAVATINSLPDVSASGATNTIKFRGDLGSATDGGAINTLTEEEIAVATARGWTVTLA